MTCPERGDGPDPLQRGCQASWLVLQLRFEGILFMGAAGGVVASQTSEVLDVILLSPHVVSGLTALIHPW